MAEMQEHGEETSIHVLRVLTNLLKKKGQKDLSSLRDYLRETSSLTSQGQPQRDIYRTLSDLVQTLFEGSMPPPKGVESDVRQAVEQAGFDGCQPVKAQLASKAADDGADTYALLSDLVGGLAAALLPVSDGTLEGTAMIIRQALPALADSLVPLVRNAIIVKSLPVESEDELQLGASKIGGRPDLPPQWQHPESNGQRMALVAQFNLGELSTFDFEEILPESGMLYFFYDRPGEPWDSRDGVGYRAMYHDGDTSDLTRSGEDLDVAIDFMAAAVKVWREMALPDYTGDFFHVSYYPESRNDESKVRELTEQEDATYEQLQYQVAGRSEREPAANHQLLGYPDQFQGEIFDALNEGDVDGNAQDWVLLLQMDNDDYTGMWWADGGILQYWIKRKDLQARDFSKTIVKLQSM